MFLYVHVEENVFEICEILHYYEIGSIAKIENENVLQNVINGKENWRSYNRNSLTWSFKNIYGSTFPILDLKFIDKFY